MQVPPTPTPQPQGTPHFTIPADYTLWSSTSVAIQYWNWLGVIAVMIQAAALVVIVFLGIKVVINFLNEFTREDAEE